jgi:hypothetical protein
MEEELLAKKRIIRLTESKNLSDNEKINSFINYVRNAQNTKDKRVIALIGYLAFSGSDIITEETRELLRNGIRDEIYSEQVVVGAQRFYEKVLSGGSEDPDSDHTHRSYFFTERGIKQILNKN